MNILYNISCITLKLNLKIWTKYRVMNTNLIPKKGNLLIISNHQSNIDAGLLGASINRRLKFPAKIELFKNPLMDFFLRAYGAFPIKRGVADINSFKKMKETLSIKNGSISIFPEGTRSNGELLSGKPGAAKLAYNLDPLILPVGIVGTSHLKGLFRVFNPSGNITVTIGKPFKINKASELVNEKGFFKDLTDEMMLRISELLPLEKRGVYKNNTKEDYLLTKDN
mgnify:FL=1|tara:strand:- start:1284 stop:1958 length:675 start_codon:yes stop_codon:yes gene_type:complete